MTLQPGVTPFLAAQDEVYTLGQPFSLCFHTAGGPSSGAQYVTGGDSPALGTPGCCGSILPAHGRAHTRACSFPCRSHPSSALSSLSGQEEQHTNTSLHPVSLSNLFFSNHETPIKPGSAPRFTQAVVGREEEGSREQSITFVALLRAAVWQMSSTV